MAGQLIDLDPETAYLHAAAAAKRAGRVDVVREATALTAYASGRYEEALRELRAVRRMRGDNSLRAVEADAERGLGRPEKAIAIIDDTDTTGMELSEQVELLLVSSGARADLGQNEVGLLLVDDAIAQLSEDIDTELLRRLMSVKVDRLRELGRNDEADEVEAAIPPEIEDPEIVDISLYADADVDRKPSPLRGTEAPLSQEYDTALLDLDGTAYAGKDPIPHAAESTNTALDSGMKIAYVTNNAMRTPETVAGHLKELGFNADPAAVMTSSMDASALLTEHLPEGAKILVIGAEGLRSPIEAAGFTVVESADDAPDAVVQGLDKAITWEAMSEAAFALQRGAQFFATNLDSTLPVERGFALGNGALVRAVQHATGVRPIAAGKPEPGIYHRGTALVGGEQPIAVGDRLETDIQGAVTAGIPALHVLTGVNSARDVILASRGQRPTYLALDMRGLNEAHPRPKHHRDGTWTCGFSQVVKVSRDGILVVDDVELSEATTVTLDTYRALAAAAWEHAMESRGNVVCPDIAVVDNDDPAGVVVTPEPAETEAFDDADLELGAEADEMSDASDSTVTFLPGEEELESLLEETADMEEDSEE
ncbi:MAG: hydrolase [Actinobacteria bacterium]|nr:MAG: hydrolase [Actinomycetota bacterium]